MVSRVTSSCQQRVTRVSCSCSRWNVGKTVGEEGRIDQYNGFGSFTDVSCGSTRKRAVTRGLLCREIYLHAYGAEREREGTEKQERCEMRVATRTEFIIATRNAWAPLKVRPDTTNAPWLASARARALSSSAQS